MAGTVIILILLMSKPRFRAVKAPPERQTWDLNPCSLISRPYPQLLFYASTYITASYDKLHGYKGIGSTVGIREGFPNV